MTGDWNGDGKTKIGVYRGGAWLLDMDGNGTFEDEGGKDLIFNFGGSLGDIPVVGDWNGDGKSKAGVFRLGRMWILDANGNGHFDDTGPGKDLVFVYGGIAGDLPVVGDWNGEGKSDVGVFRHDHYWILDNGNGNFDGVGPAKAALSFSEDSPTISLWLEIGTGTAGARPESCDMATGSWMRTAVAAKIPIRRPRIHKVRRAFEVLFWKERCVVAS